MAGEQFHIYIHDGANTVAYGRDFLREQDAELNRAMTEFMQACKDEKEAFDQSIDSMGNQCYNSNQLHEEAKSIAWKAEERVRNADACLMNMRGYISNAESWVYQAEDAIRTAESEISTCEGNISSLKQDIANEKQVNIILTLSYSNIERMEKIIKNAKGYLYVIPSKDEIENQEMMNLIPSKSSLKIVMKN